MGFFGINFWKLIFILCVFRMSLQMICDIETTRTVYELTWWAVLLAKFYQPRHCAVGVLIASTIRVSVFSTILRINMVVYNRCRLSTSNCVTPFLLEWRHYYCHLGTRFDWWAGLSKIDWGGWMLLLCFLSKLLIRYDALGNTARIISPVLCSLRDT